MNNGPANFKDNLNSWLYGKTLNFFFKTVAAIQGKEKILETLSQECNGCKAKLETFITHKQEGIKSTDWFVVQCDNCKEYNLIESPPDAHQLKFGSYKWIDTLSKAEYTDEAAHVRLEQIKFFRNN